jgi:hypothetical protein
MKKYSRLRSGAYYVVPNPYLNDGLDEKIPLLLIVKFSNVGSPKSKSW